MLGTPDCEDTMMADLWSAWECIACYFIGVLDEHGRCGRCGSDAVIPINLVVHVPELWPC
jgi:hypothetical protein